MRGGSQTTRYVSTICWVPRRTAPPPLFFELMKTRRPRTFSHLLPGRILIGGQTSRLKCLFAFVVRPYGGRTLPSARPSVATPPRSDPKTRPIPGRSPWPFFVFHRPRQCPIRGRALIPFLLPPPRHLLVGRCLRPSVGVVAGEVIRWGRGSGAILTAGRRHRVMRFKALQGRSFDFVASVRGSLRLSFVAFSNSLSLSSVLSSSLLQKISYGCVAVLSGRMLACLLACAA
jgi:hypothetical protein